MSEIPYYKVGFLALLCILGPSNIIFLAYIIFAKYETEQ